MPKLASFGGGRGFGRAAVGKFAVSGGTLFSDATYFYRRFLGTENLIVENGILNYDALLVGGGGGGGGAGVGNAQYNGQNYGGGGGGGGVLLVTNKALNSGRHLVQVPGGGGNARIGLESDIAYAGGDGGGAGLEFAGAGGNGASGGSGGWSTYNTNPYSQEARAGAGGLALYGAQGTNGQSGGSGSSGGGLNTTAYASEWTSKVGLGSSALSTPGTGGQYYTAGYQGPGYGGGGGGSSEIDSGWGNSFRGGSGGQQGFVIIRYTRSQIPL
jgi:hypothetical protein